MIIVRKNVVKRIHAKSAKNRIVVVKKNVKNTIITKIIAKSRITV
jgi:hypothetical protein